MATITYSWEGRAPTFFLNDAVTAGSQGSPAIAANVTGSRFLAAWDDPVLFGSVEARLVNASGVLVASQFRVSPSPTYAQSGSSIVGLSNGTYVVVYKDDSLASAGEIRGRLIGADGVPIGSDFTVSAGTADSLADVAVLANGNFVVSWSRDFTTDMDLRARVFTPTGTVIGGSIAVENDGAITSSGSSVAGLAGGGFVIASSQAPTGEDDSVVFRRYDSAGAPVGSAVTVGSLGSVNADAQVLALADGGFVVAYTDNSWGISGTEISARIYNADGSARTNLFVVNESTTNDQDKPTLALLSNGSFAVGWTDAGSLYLQSYSADGVALGSNHDAVGSVIEGEIAGLTGGLVAIARSSTIADQLGGTSIRASTVEFIRTTTGTEANEFLAGDSIGDVINGQDGADFIAGGGGGDDLDGGAGFDAVSWFDAGRPAVINLANQALNGQAAAGDTIANFEAYYLTNFGDSFTNANADAFIYGFGGADSITGGSGVDFIDGGVGSDTINGGGGFDYASYSNATSGVRLDFTNPASNTGEAAGDAISNVEAFYLTAQGDIFIGQSGQNFVFAGNGGDNLFGGTNANDWLFGEGGADFISGGNFDDLLSGGAGADTYAFTSWVGNGFDSILDFTSGQDKFQLTGAGFGMLAGTAITGGFNFVASAAPVASGARGTLLYNTANGILYYDPDGTGAGAAIALAQILNAPTVTAGDFVVA